MICNTENIPAARFLSISPLLIAKVKMSKKRITIVLCEARIRKCPER
jgi:hypothetical protein